MPSFLLEAASSPSMLRLQDVGMHCGLEYTSYPYFSKVEPYSRYAHSLGVAMIVFHFTGDPKQAFAGLYHDIATPCFSHVVDFLKGDHETQESTEEATRSIIESDPKNMENLCKSGIKLDEVDDYHRYPIADNDSPKLSADRLEYSLANFLHFGFASKEEAQSLYDDLIVSKDEEGAAELAFRSLDKAKIFGHLMMKNADMYSRKEDRYAMEMLSRLLRRAIEEKVIAETDLYGREKDLVLKLSQSHLSRGWEDFARLSRVETKPDASSHPFFAASIMTKKRWINPLVHGQGRLSELDAEFGKMVHDFLSLSFDETLYGYAE